MRKDVIKVALRKLKQIEQWFLKQRKFAFYASSILIVYDGGVKHKQCVRPSSDLVIGSDGTCDTPVVSDGTCDTSVNNDGTLLQNGANCGLTSDDKVLDNCDKLLDNATDITVNLSHLEGQSSPHSGSQSSCNENIEIQNNEPTNANSSETSTNLSNINNIDHVPVEIQKGGNSEPVDYKEEEEEPQVELCMIDFTHVFHSNELDDNYLFGIQNLVKHFQLLLDMPV